jgi:glucokinase
MIYLDYGTGIGLGVISGGKLLRGHGECAGELGHTCAVEDGPPCRCGGFGCLEAVAGVGAIAARARKALSQGGCSKVLELAGGDVEQIAGTHVMEAARQGDKMCAAITEDMAGYIGAGLANVVNLLNPALVVVDRRLGAADPVLLDRIARIVRRKSLAASTQDLAFRYSSLGPQAGVLGVALMVLDRLFEIPALKLPRFMTEPELATTMAGASDRLLSRRIMRS